MVCPGQLGSETDCDSTVAKGFIGNKSSEIIPLVLVALRELTVAQKDLAIQTRRLVPVCLRSGLSCRSQKIQNNTSQVHESSNMAAHVLMFECGVRMAVVQPGQFDRWV